MEVEVRCVQLAWLSRQQSEVEWKVEVAVCVVEARTPWVKASPPSRMPPPLPLPQARPQMRHSRKQLRQQQPQPGKQALV